MTTRTLVGALLLALVGGACGKKKATKKGSSGEMAPAMARPGADAAAGAGMVPSPMKLKPGPPLRFLGFDGAAGGKERVARVAVYNAWKKPLYRVRFAVVFHGADGGELGRLPWSFNRPRTHPVPHHRAIVHDVPLLAVMGSAVDVKKVSLHLVEVTFTDGTTHRPGMASK